MREIKFRAWIQADLYDESDPPKMEMCYDLAFEDYEPVNDLLGSVEHLMQYTGLKDKNGVEIYEGDIVTATTDYGLDMRAHYIEFNTNDAAFTLQVDDACMLMRDVRNIEVIGNIYENPELLEANQ